MLFPCSLANIGKVNSSRQEHRYIEPFEYDVFQVRNKSNSGRELMIRFGQRNQEGPVIEYHGSIVRYDERNEDQGTPIRREKELPVMVSYDTYTIYANVVRIHTKTLRVEAADKVIIDDGQQRIYAKQLEFDPSATNPIIAAIKD